MNIQTVLKNFSNRGFNIEYFETAEEAICFINDIIPKGSVVGFGGSQTVADINLLENLPERTLLHKSICPDVNPDELMARMHSADWYVCSANALSATGDIINIDGRGNRVAETIYGPKNVLIIAGVNKITDDIQSDIERVRNVASPKNCVRLNKKTPCAITGKCSYCNSYDTICKATVILHHPTTGKNVVIVLINKNLGF